MVSKETYKYRVCKFDDVGDDSAFDNKKNIFTYNAKQSDQKGNKSFPFIIPQHTIVAQNPVEDITLKCATSKWPTNATLRQSSSS